jgi:hypothetical protein
MTEFETMKNDMNSKLYPSINNEEEPTLDLSKGPWEKIVKHGVSESQTKLVEFLLYDDNIRGVDDIEWNNFGYIDSDDDEFEDYEDDDERTQHNDYIQNEALQCFSWYRLNNYYKDEFDNNNHKIPTYSFKNETWILNVNNFLKIGL